MDAGRCLAVTEPRGWRFEPTLEDTLDRSIHQILSIIHSFNLITAAAQPNRRTCCIFKTLSLSLRSLPHHHVHIFISFPLGSLCFVFFFPPPQFLTFAFAGRRRHSLGSQRARRISITLSGGADAHLPADESREPAGEAGRKVRVQQLWIIDTGQDGEFTGQPCQVMYGCICI